MLNLQLENRIELLELYLIHSSFTGILHDDTSWACCCTVIELQASSRVAENVALQRSGAE